MMKSKTRTTGTAQTGSAQKGFIAVSLSLIVFMSLMGAMLLTFCLTHTMIVRARTFKIKETGNLHQDLVGYLHYFRERILSEDINRYGTPETGYFNSDEFPDTLMDPHNSHMVSHDFSYLDFPRGTYKRTLVTARLHAYSASGRHPYHLVSGCHIGVLSGDIPLPLFSFVVDTTPAVPVKRFFEEKKVTGGDGGKVAGDIDKKRDITGFLVDTLRLSGTVLSWREIREKLGLPPADEPVPEGIHLLMENGVLHTVVIQGDVEKIIFSTSEGGAADPMQKIRIIKETVSYEIGYRPGEHFLQCWDTTAGEGTLFGEKIMVNGNVWSITQDGEAAFLESAAIVMTVSGQAVVRSSLKTQNLELKEIELSGLTLACGKEDLFSGGGDAEVVVDAPEEEEIDVHASVITEGKFTNRAQRLNLSGSVSCGQLENNGSIDIRHTPRSSNPAVSPYFQAIGFCFIADMSVVYIEEVSDEDI